MAAKQRAQGESAVGRRQRLGEWGERVARGDLEARGYVVRDARWRCRYGEIDLVAVSPEGVVCFVEVRASRSVRFGGALASLTGRKRRRMAELAARYLQEHALDAPARCDLFLLQYDGSAWHTEYIPSALDAQGAPL